MSIINPALQGLCVWFCIALPLLAAMYALYFILRRNNLPKESLIAKCGGTFIPLATLFVGILLSDTEHSDLSADVRLALCFVFLCMAADALLEIKLKAGMTLFAAAHIVFAVYLKGLSQANLWSLPVWAVVYIILLFIFKKDLAGSKLKLPFLLYAAVLTGVFALASPMFFSAKTGLILTAAGSLIFLVSDCFVAKSILSANSSAKSEWMQKTAMVLYWGSLMITASSVWFF